MQAGSEKSSDGSAAIPEPSWTVRQVAQYLQLTEDTVRRMAQSGELQGKKFRKEWRFDPNLVRDLLKP